LATKGKDLALGFGPSPIIRIKISQKGWKIGKDQLNNPTNLPRRNLAKSKISDEPNFFLSQEFLWY